MSVQNINTYCLYCIDEYVYDLIDFTIIFVNIMTLSYNSY